MKKLKGLIILLFISLSLFGLTACKQENDNTPITYEQISAQTAKEIMDNSNDYIIIDARTNEEFAEGHIKNAVNLDYEDVEEKANVLLPDKNQLILVYCRSGRRSKIAAQALINLGYTNIKEFGGIIDWPYETEK